MAIGALAAAMVAQIESSDLLLRSNREFSRVETKEGFAERAFRTLARDSKSLQDLKQRRNIFVEASGERRRRSRERKGKGIERTMAPIFIIGKIKWNFFLAVKRREAERDLF